jgi:hypothetical protein
VATESTKAPQVTITAGYAAACLVGALVMLAFGRPRAAGTPSAVDRRPIETSLTS